MSAIIRFFNATNDRVPSTILMVDYFYIDVNEKQLFYNRDTQSSRCQFETYRLYVDSGCPFLDVYLPQEEVEVDDDIDLYW